MHRQRLIDAEMLRPLNETERNERKESLYNSDLSSRYNKNKDKPLYCVFRSDKPFGQLCDTDPEYACENPELIEKYLYSWEAWRLCNFLNFNDKQCENSGFSHVGMYRICKVSEWKEWKNEHSQLELSEV